MFFALFFLVSCFCLYLPFFLFLLQVGAARAAIASANAFSNFHIPSSSIRKAAGFEKRRAAIKPSLLEIIDSFRFHQLSSSSLASEDEQCCPCPFQ